MAIKAFQAYDRLGTKASLVERLPQKTRRIVQEELRINELKNKLKDGSISKTELLELRLLQGGRFIENTAENAPKVDVIV